MSNVAEGKGTLDISKARETYVKFMTTPGTHNDTYCGTCHRMFFKNREDGKPLDKCPDNDAHNVDTIDALAALPPVILGASASEGAEMEKRVNAGVRLFREPTTVTTYAQVLHT